MKELNLNGFIAPGHVSTIIGLKPYEEFPKNYQIPTIVAGFEPLDVMVSILMILRQLAQKKPALENEYVRAVHYEGNVKAQLMMQKVFEIVDGKWRGLGEISCSKLKTKKEYARFDAHQKYGLRIEEGLDSQPGCRCHLVVVGRIKPTGCPLFMKKCTPQKPVGACMVSTEGTCRIWAKMINTVDSE